MKYDKKRLDTITRTVLWILDHPREAYTLIEEHVVALESARFISKLSDKFVKFANHKN